MDQIREMILWSQETNVRGLVSERLFFPSLLDPGKKVQQRVERLESQQYIVSLFALRDVMDININVA